MPINKPDVPKQAALRELQDAIQSLGYFKVRADVMLRQYKPLNTQGITTEQNKREAISMHDAMGDALNADLKLKEARRKFYGSNN